VLVDEPLLLANEDPFRSDGLGQSREVPRIEAGDPSTVRRIELVLEFQKWSVRHSSSKQAKTTPYPRRNDW
jgi:hypothetical protein